MLLVGWVLTGSAALGGMIAVLNCGIGFAAYVVYERIWARVPWGRNPAGLPVHGEQCQTTPAVFHRQPRQR